MYVNRQKVQKDRWVLFLLLAVFFSMVGSVSAADTSPVAREGVIDLSRIDWERYGTVALQGEWEFYWKELILPEGEFGSSYIQVPSTWKRAGMESNHGYATYRLVLRLGEEARNRGLALYIPSVATAYKLWVDGRLLAANGVVGTSLEEMTPKNFPRVVFFRPDATEVELLLHISNFVQRKGGMWQEIRLGTAEVIQLQRERNVAFEGGLAACLFLMGLYHFGLFVIRPKARSALYFGGLCITIAIRMLFLGETLAVRFFPDLSWETGVKLEYLSATGGILLLLLFVHSQYPQEGNHKLHKIFTRFGIGWMLFVLLTPARVYTELLLVQHIFLVIGFCHVIRVCLTAARHKRTGSLVNGVGLLLFFIATLNEILYYFNLSTLEDTVAIGLFVFLFTQMMRLSIEFSRTFDRVERLSEALKKSNESLEEKVRSRTQALEEKTRKLYQMEESRRLLLSNIAHELGTPLTSIQGFVKAMIDGIVKPGDPKYLAIIYDKTNLLKRIITDLFDLAKMEAKQIHFDLKPLPLVSFLRHIHEKHMLDMEKKGLRFVFETAPIVGVNDNPLVLADPIRLEQVVVNLLTNAQTYTPAEGMITLRLELEQGDGERKAWISVKDTGAGIAEEDLPLIFDRFYKGSQARKMRTNSVGLGLAISKEIIQNLKGEIMAESRVGEGSTFRFSLPIYREGSAPGSSM